MSSCGKFDIFFFCTDKLLNQDKINGRKIGKGRNQSVGISIYLGSFLHYYNQSFKFRLAFVVNKKRFLSRFRVFKKFKRFKSDYRRA